MNLRIHLFHLACCFIILSSCKKVGDSVDIPLTGDPDIDSLSIAIAKDPDNPVLYFQRASIFNEHEAYDQAISDLATGMKFDSMNLKAHHLLADVYLDDLQSSMALRTMERAARLYPDSINTLLKLSEFQLILKQYDGVYQTIEKIMQVKPGHPEALFMLGLSLRDQGREKEAAGALQSAVERDPDLVEAWVTLGELMEKAGDPNAEKYFDNAIRQAPRNISVLHAKAYYLQNQERYSEAIALYKQIHEIDRRYPEAYLNTTILYLIQDSIPEAEKEVNILTEIAPLLPEAWFYKGRVLQSQDKKEEAIQAYKQALRLNPDYGQAIDGLKELE